MFLVALSLKGLTFEHGVARTVVDMRHRNPLGWVSVTSNMRINLQIRIFRCSALAKVGAADIMSIKVEIVLLND